METEQCYYFHDLGNGQLLKSFSVDQNIGLDELVSLVSSMERPKDRFVLDDLEKNMHLVAAFDSLSKLELKVLDGRYEVPHQLLPYREAIEQELLKEGKKNNSVMIVKGDIAVPLTIVMGKYFDFMATKLSDVPAKRLPATYPANKTIGDLLRKYGLRDSDTARYLGFAFILMPSNGKELSFVQRAKGLGIVPGVMALSGMTPLFHDGFYEKGFDFRKYFEKEIARELEEEYRLLPNEFRTGRCYFIYNKGINHPFVAIEITTTLSIEEIARRAFGEKKVIEEHPILYSIGFPAIGTLIRKFDLGDSAYVMSLVAKEKGYK